MSRTLVSALTVLASIGLAAGSATASESVRAGKGMAALPETSSARGAAPACHPDPAKGRACRHHIAKAESAAADHAVLAQANAGVTKASAD